jgi:hypothetical protein
MKTAEIRLLFATARSIGDPEATRELASGEIDWRAFLDLALRHDVVPLVFRNLKSIGWREIPHEIRVALEQCHRDGVVRNLFLVSELLRISDAFSRAGIAMATFKGPALAQDAYGDSGLRIYCDLDVLVRKSDLPRAEAILKACGYRAAMGDAGYRSAFLAYHGQYVFSGPAGAFVDLHWQLSGKGFVFPLRAEEVWSGLREIVVEGRSLATFSESHTALFLAAHGSKENWRSLKWVCDFAEFSRRHPGIDWDWVAGRFEGVGSSRSLLVSVLLSADWLDAPVPPDLLARARAEATVATLAEEVLHRLTRIGTEWPAEAFMRELAAHERLAHGMLRVGSHLTTRTTGDYAALPLPRALWRFYHLTRPFRLAFVGARAWLSWSRGRGSGGPQEPR